ncbi:1-(5-phosphoribosyl)-5-[(5-phosphoribosylamino)methylideneamino]imidazole-4-carboxamide isomerase [Myxococcota bacterium]|nr:1-(5-phosphoribosyl)-5-[(5-phosphoribosylamino)methylideneamino]imidazole-4-carboxamide isomerase [Myxococcota bacterium]
MQGQCVRLSQGRYDAATVYGEDPGRVASGFMRHPVRRMHVVDLDGAKAGHPCNAEAVGAIVSACSGIPVQLGGGIRSLEAVESALGMGLERVILGTVALRNPDLVREAAARFPGRIAVGIDARDGRVAVEGWLEDSTAEVRDVARRFEDAGVCALIHTDISRDGMLTGPNLEASVSLAEAVSIPVIVSGGVSCGDDVVAASRFADRGIAGAIVGRALYTGALDLAETLERLACS